MNSVVLSGRLVYEPEIKNVPSGKKYLGVLLAVSRNDQKRTTDFINCQLWENTAVFVQKYFHKGDPIEFRGKLQVSNFEKEDGTKASETYVLVNEVSFAPSPKKAEVESAPVANPEQKIADVAPTAPSTLPFEI